MMIQQAHDKLAHPNKEDTRKTAAALGWAVAHGALGTYEGCTRGKACRANVPRGKHNKATKPNEWLYCDISTIRHKDGKKVYKDNWHIQVDKATSPVYLQFHDTKKGMIEPTCECWEQLHARGSPVKHVAMHGQCW